MITLEKGSSTTGMGDKGGCGDLLVRLPYQLTRMTGPTKSNYIFMELGLIEMLHNLGLGLSNA